MPISTQRAKRACQAIIVDDSERARFLGRHDIIKVLESPFLSEDDSDIYIVNFLNSNVAGEIQILISAIHGALFCHILPVALNVFPFCMDRQW